MNHPVVNAAKRGLGLELINSKFRLKQSDKVYWVGQEMITPIPQKLRAPLNKYSETPMVNVVVRTYNRQDFLSSCLESIADQTLKNIEAIVVNDGGPDVANLLDTFQNRLRVVYIRHPSNRGRTASLNSALKAATAKYIAYLDDDDIYYPDHLEILVAELEKGQFKVAYSDALEVTQCLSNGQYRDVQQRLVYSQDFNRDLLLKTNYIPILNVLHRRDCLEEVEAFDEDLKVLEDWDFWIRLSRKFDFIHVPKVTAEYHVRTDATNATTSGIATFPKYRRRVWEKHRHCIEEAFGKRESQTTSIVIPTFNELKYTKECIVSIKKHTPESHEIIFVDNGSTDGTVKWMRKLAKNNSRYKLIENKKNLGFSKGCNQGIEASSGEYILLLNNDVVVTENWLAGMLECLHSAHDIGIVSPMTNNISGPQRVPVVGYPSIEGLASYAREFREKNRYRRIARKRVVGFCMLFKRLLIEEVGLLDESFGSGNFEDDDLCLRVSLAGYRNMIAGDVFIHHFGRRTFIGNRIDYSSSLSRNRKIFTGKWSGKDVAQRFGKKLLIENAIAKADDFQHQGQVEKAAATMLEAIKLSPDDRSLYFNLAEMLIDAKRFEDACGLLESMPPGDADAGQLSLLGFCEEALSRNEKAQDHVDRALSIEPTNLLALNTKGVLAYKEGEKDAAETIFKKAIELDPGYSESYTNLGSLKWGEGERAEGLNLFERGFTLSPTAADVITAYHSAVADTGEFERAETVFREAQALFPNDKRITFLMISLLVQQDKNDAAISEIENAMMRFGIDDGILSAAMDIRAKIGPVKIQSGGRGRSLSVCMIVKNEESHLPKCLMSVKPVADEVIVVDTGSADKTKLIASALGAKVFDFAWANDFSEARNYSLSKASGDWILVLDADEVVSAMDHAALRSIINKADRRFAYIMTTRNYTDQAAFQNWTANDGKYFQEEAASGWLPSPKVRLFTNDKRIRFVDSVHELVEPTLKENGICIKDCSIPIHHYGRLDQDRVAAKGEEYYRLGKKKVQETQGDYKALKELAIQTSEIGKYEESLPLWENLLKLNPKDAVAHLNLGYALIKLSRYEQALICSKNALELDPKSKEAGLNYGGCELIIGDVKKAIAALDKLLQKNPDYPPALARLAAALIIDGRKKEGLKCLEQLRLLQFDCLGALSEHARAFLSQKRFEKAIALLEVAVETRNANTDTRKLLAECRLRSESPVLLEVSRAPDVLSRELMSEQHL